MKHIIIILIITLSFQLTGCVTVKTSGGNTNYHDELAIVTNITWTAEAWIKKKVFDSDGSFKWVEVERAIETGTKKNKPYYHYTVPDLPRKLRNGEDYDRKFRYNVEFRVKRTGEILIDRDVFDTAFDKFEIGETVKITSLFRPDDFAIRGVME